MRLRLAAGLAALLLCLIPFAGAGHAQPKFPALTGRIVDEARLLRPEDRNEILSLLRTLEEKSTDQIVVYTTPSLQGYEIEEFGYRLGRTWQIGQKDKNNGIVLIVAPKERKVRIEVGRGLEPQMTDLMSRIIIENTILPAFRRGDFSAGVRAGVRDIKDVLLGDAEAVKERARGGRKQSSEGNDNADLILFIIFVAIILVFFWVQSQQARQLPKNARYRRNDGDVIVHPGGWGGSGGWPSGSGSGSSGSSDPDSGWSGGGGDFGGGGASGSW